MFDISVSKDREGVAVTDAGGFIRGKRAQTKPHKDP